MDYAAIRLAAAPPRRRVADLLAHAPIFRGLSPDELARIAAGTREVRMQRGDVLFQRGDPCIGFHIVAVGQVKLAFVTPDGSEKVVEILGPGTTFGEAVMFMEKPYLVAATALTDGLVLHVSRDTVFGELDRDPRLARRMLASVSMRQHMIMKDMEAMTLQSALQRVIGYLLRLDDSAEEAPATFAVTLPAQKSLVASRLNLTPEYFSRILGELTAAKLIQVEGRRIEVRDAEGLKAFGTREE